MGGVQLTYYDIPNQYAGQIPRDTGVRNAPLRGIGDIANKFVAESFLDEVAHKRSVDPMQFRLELLKNTPRGQKVLQRVGEMADWGRKRDNTALGCAFIVYNDTLISGVAEVSVDHSTGQIRVQNFWCVVDCGIAVQPDNIVAQFEGGIVYGLGLALTEEISVRDGAVQQNNFYDYRVMRMSRCRTFTSRSSRPTIIRPEWARCRCQSSPQPSTMAWRGSPACGCVNRR